MDGWDERRQRLHRVSIPVLLLQVVGDVVLMTGLRVKHLVALGGVASRRVLARKPYQAGNAVKLWSTTPPGHSVDKPVYSGWAYVHLIS
jgi:hypothetical protein